MSNVTCLSDAVKIVNSITERLLDVKETKDILTQTISLGDITLGIHKFTSKVDMPYGTIDKLLEEIPDQNGIVEVFVNSVLFGKDGTKEVISLINQLRQSLKVNAIWLSPFYENRSDPLLFGHFDLDGKGCIVVFFIRNGEEDK